MLTDADIAEFRADPTLRANLLRSFEVFLAFLGLRFEGGKVAEAPDFAAKQQVWRHPNHNWLRITRVLASTRLLGLEDASRAFFDFLKAYRDGGRSGITADSFRYWEDAATASADGESSLAGQDTQGDSDDRRSRRTGDPPSHRPRHVCTGGREGRCRPLERPAAETVPAEMGGFLGRNLV